jgi:pimeloyl-ACP methyl ester carboxylesterase
MPFFRLSGVDIYFVEVGNGIPFVFQHGIGGDVGQPTGLFNPPPGVRLISFDARAHGQTVPLGDAASLRFDTFGDDLIALLDHLGLFRAVIGGISMGAGVALNVAVRYPKRVAGLVLSRPAWLDGPMPDAVVSIFDRIARLLRGLEVDDRNVALSRLELDPAFRAIAANYPDTAQSLRSQVTERRAREAVARLEMLPRDQPIHDLRDVAGVEAPTLVLAHKRDLAHPFEFGVELARTIPDAMFARLTPKSVDKKRHAAEVQHALTTFFKWQKEASAVLGHAA